MRARSLLLLLAACGSPPPAAPPPVVETPKVAEAPPPVLPPAPDLAVTWAHGHPLALPWSRPVVPDAPPTFSATPVDPALREMLGVDAATDMTLEGAVWLTELEPGLVFGTRTPAAGPKSKDKYDWYLAYRDGEGWARLPLSAWAGECGQNVLRSATILPSQDVEVVEVTEASQCNGTNVPISTTKAVWTYGAGRWGHVP